MQLPDPLSYSEADKQAILEARARALAQPLAAAPRGETFQVVVFSLADERYAVEVRHVAEVESLERLTPVPCTPDFVAGVVNLRGRLFSVVDIRRFFDVPESALTGSTKIILVNAAGLEVGLLADEVMEIVDLPRADLEPPLATHQGIRQEYIQGLTSDMLVVLDLETLMRDPRMIVNEEVV